MNNLLQATCRLTKRLFLNWPEGVVEDFVQRSLSREIGDLIARDKRNVTVEVEDDGTETHRLEVYVFTPGELALFIDQQMEKRRSNPKLRPGFCVICGYSHSGLPCPTTNITVGAKFDA